MVAKLCLVECVVEAVLKLILIATSLLMSGDIGHATILIFVDAPVSPYAM